MLKKVDFLIVGQGIAGTLLALELMKHEKSIMVLDEGKADTSSKKAGGLYNPITGRHMVKTWMADELFEGLQSYYDELQVKLNSTFHFPKTIYRPFFSVEEQNDWQGKATLPEYAPYIKEIHTQSLKIQSVQDPFGGLELARSGSVDLPIMLDAAKTYFHNHGAFQETSISYSHLREEENGYRYQNITAAKVIFCEGPDALKNPYFEGFLFKPVKGEVLEIETELSSERIFNRGVFMLPKEGYFKVGSTYDHSVLDHVPTERGKKEITERLNKIYTGEFAIKRHIAGVRPATYDRRPFIGMLEKFPNIGIFNGFGTKGVSLVPFFATQFVNYLLGKANLSPEVDIQRLKKG